MIRKIVSALFAALLLFTSCLKSDEGLFAGKKEEVKTAYATKVVNSPEEADENSLLLFLEESAVKTLAQGGADEALSALCAEAGVLRMERLFVSNNELARSKGLHRWYVLTFETPQNPQLMAEKFAGSCRKIKGADDYETFYEKTDSSMLCFCNGSKSDRV